MEKIKKLVSLVKNWFVSNGFEGILGLIIGIFLWVFGYKIGAGVAFGVFATKNWEIIKGFILNKISKKE
jgi:hypothetical protein